jgi:hypothetical protein
VQARRCERAFALRWLREHSVPRTYRPRPSRPLKLANLPRVKTGGLPGEVIPLRRTRSQSTASWQTGFGAHAPTERMLRLRCGCAAGLGYTSPRRAGSPGGKSTLREASSAWTSRKLERPTCVSLLSRRTDCRSHLAGNCCGTRSAVATRADPSLAVAAGPSANNTTATSIYNRLSS